MKTLAFMRTVIPILAVTCLVFPGLAQESVKPPAQPSIDEVIKRFAAAESENKLARNNYTFTQDIDLLTIGPGGSITGRYHRVSDIIYDDLGNRIERITYFPQPTLTSLMITREDLQDFAGVHPFVLTLEDLPKYEIKYVTKERVDELDTYVFEVTPRKFVKGERYFQGRIWVDDQDFQIVKAAGQAVPEVDDQRFPRFETYRENIDGRYWFPTYTYADDELDFRKGPSIHIRMVVRYTNYKKFGGTIRVLEGGSVSEENPPPPQPRP